MTINLNSYYGILDGKYGLILTANSVEKEAVSKVLGHGVKADIGVTHQGCVLCFRASHVLLHVTGLAGGLNERTVGYIARQFLNGRGPKPGFIILTGICWGNPNKVHTGDVIVATDVASLNHQREGALGRTYRRTDKRSPLELEESLLNDIADSKTFHIHHGAIGSAELYLAADGPRDAVIDQHPDLLGGEMEAFGFLAELGDVPWIIVKGVSDYAGDETDKSAQLPAAQNAASFMSELLQALTESDVLAPPAATPPRSALIDAIIGESIAISRVSDQAQLNDYLNDEIGPKLEQRLARYISDDSAQVGLHRALMKLILEIIQNTLRHGNASRATLTFYETRIDLHDDGRHFDFTSLSGDRGGAIAWSDFSTRFIETGMAAVTCKQASKNTGNHYTFKIEQLAEALRHARNKCSANIQERSIGAPGGFKPILRYDSSCETIHVSVHNVRMISRGLEIVQAIILEIQAGKTIFIACPDSTEKLFYEKSLTDYLGPQLRIYVADRAGV